MPSKYPDTFERRNFRLFTERQRKQVWPPIEKSDTLIAEIGQFSVKLACLPDAHLSRQLYTRTPAEPTHAARLRDFCPFAPNYINKRVFVF